MFIMDINLLDVHLNDDEPKSKCIVRLTTSGWNDHRGYHIKQSLNYLRKQCKGYNVLEEDANIDPYAINIVNLHECSDGVYEVVLCNKSMDRETGYLDDYDFKLIKRQV